MKAGTRALRQEQQQQREEKKLEQEARVVESCPCSELSSVPMLPIEGGIRTQQVLVDE